MKTIFPLLSIAIRIFGVQLLIFGILAGLSNTLLILIINESIKKGGVNQYSTILLASVFAGTLLLYFSLQFFYQKVLIHSSEKLIYNNKIELINKIRRSNLRSFEKIGENTLFILLAYDSNVLGQLAALSSALLISFIMIAGALFYLIALSVVSFLLTALIICISLMITFSMQKKNILRIHQLLEMETTFLNFAKNMLSGMKEVKMDSKINEGMYQQHILPQLEVIARKRADNNTFQARFGLLGQAIFFVSLGFVLFVFPLFHISLTDNPAQFVITLLYVISPLQNIIPIIPQFSQMRATMNRVESVKRRIVEDEQNKTNDEAFGRFRDIQINSIQYTYNQDNDDGSFSIGPINMKIEHGDLIFLMGENGSGKSTFAKVLTGLYAPECGTIHVNGQPILAENIQDYRNLFGAVFTDNYLMNYVYGVDNADTLQVAALIDKLGLTEKTSFHGNAFSTIDLSEGQKKRIALICTLLRDKPIYIFDEWAANQDPDFRRFFYRELIPQLNSAGKTIIIITHDHSNIDIAKKVFTMKDGMLQEEVIEKI